MTCSLCSRNNDTVNINARYRACCHRILLRRIALNNLRRAVALLRVCLPHLYDAALI